MDPVEDPTRPETGTGSPAGDLGTIRLTDEGVVDSMYDDTR